MAQISYRGNLTSGHFPFLSAYQGQTVIVGGKDQAFQNQVVVGQDSEDKDKGFPQLYYCHNVVPTLQGIQSVGFINRLPGIDASVDFDDVFILRDIEENKYLFSPAAGNNYVFDGNNAVWQTANSAPNVPPVGSLPVTVAYLNGHTYVFFPEDGCYEYDNVTEEFVAVPFTGVTAADLLGITSANGFLIAYDQFSVYRSQVTDPTDFTPDFSLGSGASIPEAIGGQIVVCLPILNGFIIYTTKNNVGATFSQNIRFPFIYAEVQGSAGINHPRHVAWQNNTGFHFAWTQAGLQKVDKSKATITFPEVTDFFAAKIFEDYDTTENEFVVTKLATQLSIKLATAGKRFLIISYGIEFPYTHALVYDLGLKRWGKVKLTHSAAFELYLPNPHGAITWDMLAELTWQDFGVTSWAQLSSILFTFEEPKELVAFLQTDGTVKTLNFDEVTAGEEGVAVLGKYQFVRERFCSIQELELENIPETPANFDVFLLSSINGRTIDRISEPYLYINEDTYRRYLSNVEGKNHSIACVGDFYLSSLEMKFHITSHR